MWLGTYKVWSKGSCVMMMGSILISILFYLQAAWADSGWVSLERFNLGCEKFLPKLQINLDFQI